MDEPKFLIAYHRDDNDGVFSGAILAHHLHSRMGIDYERIKLDGITHGDIQERYTKEDLKELRKEYRFFYLTDMSMPLECMEYARELWHHNFVWIDHHAPIIKATEESGLADKIDGLRGAEHSALYHAYQYCHRFDGCQIPKYLDGLSAWDSFTFQSAEKNRLRVINSGTTYIYGLSIERVIGLLENIDNGSETWEDVEKEAESIGNVLVADADRRNQELVQRYGDFDWKLVGLDGSERTACALFVQGPTSSVMFQSADGKALCGIVCKYTPSGRWVFSVYNVNTDYDKEFHIGQWCREKYQGGGHAGAGGFSVSAEEFQKILAEKKI